MSGGKCCRLQPRGQNQADGKTMKIGEMCGVTPNDLILKWIGLTGWAGKFGMAGLLQVIDEAEKVVIGCRELVGGAVRDTEEFDGIVVQPSFHGPVAGGADLDEAIGAFELL